VPHAVIEGRLDLAAWAAGFRPILERRGEDVLRAESVWLAGDAREALVRALVVEAGRRQAFYVLVSAHAERATVRIDPLTRVERSDGVRALVALVAADVLARTPGARVGATNLVLPSRA
jgi:hypothetical protein